MHQTPTTRLLLVRHGRTDYNTQGRVQGGGRLDPLGWAQVEALGARLRSELLEAVYASPLLRTMQTARAIAQPHGTPVGRRQALRDIDYGVYSGMVFADAQSRDPELWEQWRRAPDTVRFPEGGGLADLRHRLTRFVGELRRRHPGRSVLAVSHDSPIRVLACMASGLDDGHHHDYVVALASLTVIELTADGARLELLSDTHHLEALRGD